jgi:hypothetical protein
MAGLIVYIVLLPMMDSSYTTSIMLVLYLNVWKTSLVEMHTISLIFTIAIFLLLVQYECTDALWASNLGKGGNHVT